MRLKTGGRVKGTSNKRTLDFAQRLTELGFEPIEGMAIIAMDNFSPPELRGRMYAGLAQYLYPKRRATEIKTDEGHRKARFNPLDRIHDLAIGEL